jgi:hypothetical protein
VDEREMECKQQEQKIFENLYAIDIKSKKILSINVTDEQVQDNKMLLDLDKNIIKSDGMMSMVKLFVEDGVYEGNDIFRCLIDKGILPYIKVKTARI